MNVEVGKTYQCLVNGRFFKVVGLSKTNSFDVRRKGDVYLDVEFIEPRNGELKGGSYSKAFLDRLFIKEA